MTKRIADMLERRDREEHERKRPRFAPEQPNGSAQDHNVKGHPPEIAEQVQSESQGGASSSGIPTEEDVVIGDDMGIPLATDDVMGSEAKRRSREHRRPPDRSWSAHSTWRARQSSMSVRSSVDLGYAQLQEICLCEQGFR